MYLMFILTCADGIHSYFHIQMRSVSVSICIHMNDDRVDIFRGEDPSTDRTCLSVSKAEKESDVIMK